MKTTRALVLATSLIAILPGASVLAMAEKPRAEPPHVSAEVRFSSADRNAIHDYYEPRFRGGNCPPGLAKKNNGCMPPGQAKRWARGQRLSSSVSYHPLPGDLAHALSPVPRGYQYVRVDNDILLMALGTGLILDAIENYGH